MAVNGIFLCQKNRVISPCNPLFSNDFGQFYLGFHAFLYARNARLKLFSVSGYRVVEVGIKSVCDLMQPWQYGLVILRAEYNAVHRVRSQFITCYFVRK